MSALPIRLLPEPLFIRSQYTGVIAGVPEPDVGPWVGSIGSDRPKLNRAFTPIVLQRAVSVGGDVSHGTKTDAISPRFGHTSTKVRHPRALPPIIDPKNVHAANSGEAREVRVACREEQPTRRQKSGHR
jgi:hypothetical protein